MSAVFSRARSGRRELEFDMLLCEEWEEEEKIEEVGDEGRESGRLKESVNVELELECEPDEVEVEEGGVVEVG